MARKKSKKNNIEEEIPFEASLQSLRQIVEELEDGNLSLTDSLEKYEQGVTSLNRCFKALNQAQRRIELLVNLDEDGRLVTQPLDVRASFETNADRAEKEEKLQENESDSEDESGQLF